MEEIKRWNNRSEKIWLFISVISTLVTVIFFIIDKFNGDLVYFLLSILSWGIYLIRRGVGKRLNKN